MSSYTTNLTLYKKDPDTDGSDTFNIQTMMNDNWDKIDDAFEMDSAPTSGSTNLVNSGAVYSALADYATLDDLAELEAYIGYTDDDIYGVEVDFENYTFTRLAGAANLSAGSDFDSITPFGGRQRCNVTNGGVVVAYYGDAAYTETGKLTTSVTVDSTTYASGTIVQVMVEQPAFYYKVVPLDADKIDDGNGYHLRKARYYVSATPKEGFKLHPAFCMNGAINDYIYLAAYEACLWDASASAYDTTDSVTMATSADMLSSIANVKPASGISNNLTRANARILAENRGTGWELMTVQSASASQMLMLIEYGHFNMQSAIGAGVTTKTDDDSTNMAENTGATASLGNDSGAVTNGNGYNVVSYRGEENFWGNIWKWVDGMNIDTTDSSNKLYISDSSFADQVITSPYEDTGITLAKANGYIKAFGYSPDYDWLFVPSEVGGSSSLPVGDYFYQYYNRGSILISRLGSRWSDGASAGAFYWHVNDLASARTRYFGARAVYFPS